MLKTPILAALLTLLPALSVSQVPVPNTPAGQALRAWLDAFNSAETGGYDLLEVFAEDETNVFFRVKARTTAAEEVGRLRVSGAEPVAVTELRTRRIAAGAKLDAAALDAKARRILVDRVAELFDRLYVYPEIGRKMSAALRRHEARGEYRSVSYGEDLASKLTDDLRVVSRDEHAEVRFSYVVQPTELPTEHPEEEARRLAAINCGFEKAEHLPPNIGYLKLNMFADPEICALTASAAMTFLADSDTLILDLRDNNGGLGGMVEFIASYLFAERTHLNDVFRRPQNVTNEAWTLPYVPGKKFIGKPVFVLTSKRTFSAAEDLCYVLKNLQRATLIGETTGGGAHPIELERIDEQFSVIVPTGRSISPITKADWEGTGVEPDVKVSAAEALETAKRLAITWPAAAR
jgi:hypothetical protein